MLAFAGTDRKALSDRVCRDDVRGPLLELILNHPGSAVVTDRVVLVSPGMLQQDLPAAVELASELARALA